MSDKFTATPAQVGETVREFDDDTPFVYVATPAYDGKVNSDFCQSIANAAWHAFPLGIYPSFSVLANSAFIDLARNMFVAFFLNDPAFKDATHFMFIDADLKFDVNAFAGIVKACNKDRPVTAGVYPRRQKDPVDFPCMWWPHPEETKKYGEERLWYEDGWLKAKRVPTGFLCIRRNILEEMAEDAVQLSVHGYDYKVPQLFYTEIYTENGESKMIGEDFRWCDDYVAKYNRPIDVWPNLDFVHDGDYAGNYFDFLFEKIEQNEGNKAFLKGSRRMGDRRKRKKA